MSKIKILVEGYAREISSGWSASSTTTLIREGNLNIIVDPGMDRARLLKSLEEEFLTVEDIDYVILTHYHLDHSLLAGIFKNAKVLDNGEIYSFDGNMGEHDGKIPNTNINIIKTPGHDQFHCSVLVDTEEYGKMAIAGDVIWWKDEDEQKIDRKSLLSHKDPYVKDQEELTKSRETLLSSADYIIPGHGKSFKLEL